MIYYIKFIIFGFTTLEQFMTWYMIYYISYYITYINFGFSSVGRKATYFEKTFPDWPPYDWKKPKRLRTSMWFSYLQDFGGASRGIFWGASLETFSGGASKKTKFSYIAPYPKIFNGNFFGQAPTESLRNQDSEYVHKRGWTILLTVFCLQLFCLKSQCMA